MVKEIFKSDRHFTVFDFFTSHGQLLLRSSKNGDYNTNIDVVFFGVKYIQLFTSLLGLSIRVVAESKNLADYESVVSSLNYNENNLFEIETQGEKFYIVASHFRVYENELEFNETSLGIIENKGREKRIVGSH